MLRQNHTPHDRRWSLKAAGPFTAWAGGGGIFDSVAVEPRWLMLSAPTAAIPSLPPEWDGVRIAHLSDLHAGWMCGLEYLRRAVAAANAASPDLAVLTGDHVSWPSALTPEFTDLLAELQAPEGKFAILGNHDHTCGARRVTAALREAGIDVLTDRHRLLDRGGRKLCLAGVDDLKHGRPDLAAALDGVDPAVPRILLAHNPDYAESMPAQPRVDLMLCGHTHGGQIRPPFGPAPWVSLRHRRYAEGLVRGRHCLVYTTRGIGMVYLPFRLNCRPELPVITLRRA
jgi:predicted MPP superfamily phosphohydrolase